ncbi:MAG TPA: ankyrin repeat domain-containing protein, partial [bacterium]|nr:ankyrin repeat domain-containing protein [bacterium]
MKTQKCTRQEIPWIFIVIACVIVSAAASAYAPKPIPAAASVPTEKEFRSNYADWLEKQAVNIPGLDDLPEKDRAFLRTACRISARIDDVDSKRVTAAVTRMEAGQPVVVKGLAGIILVRAGNREKGIPVLKAVLNEGMPETCPDIFRFLFASELSNAIFRHFPSERLDVRRYRNEAVEAMIRAINAGLFTGKDVIHCYRMVDNLPTEPFGEDRWLAIWEGIKENKQIDYWITNMIYGTKELLDAARVRGGDWSHKVKSEDWQPFHDHSKSAYESLVFAHDLHPEFPDAAGCLVVIVLSGHPVEMQPPRYWFDKAVAAQIDYLRPYRLLSRSLMPRWGGSHAAMTAFAEECLNTNRFDTLVPMCYREIMMDIARESRADGWRYLFRRDSVKAAGKKLFDGYRSAEGWKPSDKLRIDTAEALWLLWSGEYERGATRIKALSDRCNLRDGFWDEDHSLSFNNRTWTHIDGEIASFTGSASKALRNAEAQICRQIEMNPRMALLCGESPFEMTATPELKSALNIFDNAMKNAEAPSIRTYLLDRVGRIRLNDSRMQVSAIYEAATREDDTLLKYLLKHGENPNNLTGDSSPLFGAVVYSRTANVKTLLENGADPNLHDPKTGLTPMLRALHVGNAEIIRCMIEHGGDISAVDASGRNALLYVIEQGNVELCRMCIDKGADLDVAAPDGLTPLLKALLIKNSEVANLLLEHGADVSGEYDKGYGALHLALLMRDHELSRRLLDAGADIHAVADSCSVLSAALYYEDWDIAK